MMLQSLFLTVSHVERDDPKCQETQTAAALGDGPRDRDGRRVGRCAQETVRLRRPEPPVAQARQHGGCEEKG